MFVSTGLKIWPSFVLSCEVCVVRCPWLYTEHPSVLSAIQPFEGEFLPNFEDVKVDEARVARGDFGLTRFDHIVGNVWDMIERVRCRLLFFLCSQTFGVLGMPGMTLSLP